MIMKGKSAFITSLSLYLLFLGLLATAQTTLWYQIFGSFPPPVLWLPVLVFMSLTQELYEGLLLIYLSGFFLSFLTSMPTTQLLLILLSLFFTIRMIKNRIFMPGFKYFFFICLLSGFILQFYQYLFYWIFDNLTISFSNLFYQFVQSILTPLAAAPIYYALLKIDHLQEKKDSAQSLV